MRKLILAVVGLISIAATAQTGPGGVGSNAGNSTLRFWYAASKENYVNNALVNRVADLSGYGNTLSAATTEQPRFLTAPTGINGRPAFTFDGDDELETTYQGNSNENMTFVIVYRKQNSGELDVVIQHGGRNTVGFATTGIYSNYVGGANNSGPAAPVNTWTMHAATFSNTGNDRLKMYDNNQLIATLNHTIENRTDNTFIGGHGTGGGTSLTGEIAEVMKFTKVLNTTERLIIDNYLAAKYGLTLATYDIYTQDNVASGNYDNDVAGIGRVSATDGHLDSRGTGTVRILNADNLGNNEFLLWGHDGEKEEFTVTNDLPAGVNLRSARVYRASETNAVGAAVNVGRVEVRLEGAFTKDDPADQLYFIVDTDDDGSFADETAVSGATDLGGGVFAFAGVTGIADGRRFTFGASRAALPVTFTSFSARTGVTGNDLLSWETARETESDHFAVQVSSDGHKWITLGTQTAAGYSTRPISYRFEVNAELPALRIYRIKQVDFDGSFIYSSMVTVRRNEQANESSVYPNPSPASRTVSIEPGRSTGHAWRIVDVTGRVVHERPTTKKTGELLVVPPLPAGVYYYQTEKDVLKIIKQ